MHVYVEFALSRWLTVGKSAGSVLLTKFFNLDYVSAVAKHLNPESNYTMTPVRNRMDGAVLRFLLGAVLCMYVWEINY